MNWKKVYAVFVFVIAIGAALTGAVAGGLQFTGHSTSSKPAACR